jgi:hypothetical protein
LKARIAVANATATSAVSRTVVHAVLYLVERIILISTAGR